MFTKSDNVWLVADKIGRSFITRRGVNLDLGIFRSESNAVGKVPLLEIGRLLLNLVRPEQTYSTDLIRRRIETQYP